MKLIWMLTGAAIVAVPYMIYSGTISLNTFGIFALGAGCGILLLFVLFALLWNP
jgi:hypothetical protein